MLGDTQVVKAVDIMEDAPAKPDNVHMYPSSESSRQRESTSVIGAELEFDGDLVADEDLIVMGRIKGTIKQGAHVLVLKETAFVEAKVHGSNILIEGTVRGDVSATQKVVIKPGANVEGNVVAPTVVLEENAVFNGKITMEPVKQ